MWQVEALTEKDIKYWIELAAQTVGSVSVGPAAVTPPLKALRKRLIKSLYVLKERARLVRKELDSYLVANPPPGVDVRIAVFASGSAARLELLSENEVKMIEPRKTKDAVGRPKRRSDMDFLWLVEGADVNDAYWDQLLEVFTTKAAKWFPLDGMAKPPLARFQSRDSICSLKAENAARLRNEDKRCETWRYWIMFESVLMYSYPSSDSGASGGATQEGPGLVFASGIEQDLFRYYFGIPGDLASKRFPFLWYHAACRYMSGIYLDTLRQLAANAYLPPVVGQEEVDKIAKMSKLFEKIAKLKSVRLLTWCTAVVNAIIAFEMAQRGQHEDILEIIRYPGVIMNLSFQYIFEQTVLLANAQGGIFKRDEEALKDFREFSRWQKDLNKFRGDLLEAYVKYFSWIEDEGSSGMALSLEDIYSLLHGRKQLTGISAELVSLVETASVIFQKIRYRAARTQGFSPNFLFY